MEVSGVVVCLFLSLPGLLLAEQNGELRLVGGAADNVGRVEVYYDNKWGTICDDSWHLRDGDVVCKQLGYERAERVVYRATFGEGNGPIWLDQLDCRGDESSILECRHNGWGIHDCGHREDAGIYCSRKEPTKPSSMPIRLSCPQHTAGGSCKACPTKRHPAPGDCRTQVAVEGIVEVFYNNTWRPISAEGWDNENAKVACGQLGYPIAFGSGPSLATLWPNWKGDYCGGGSGQQQCDPFLILENEAFRQRLRSTFLKKVDCTGNEHKFLDCYFPEFGPHSNPSLNVATVRCGFLPHSSCYSPTVEAYRTRAGPVPWMGRAEVRINGVWGTICDTLWDITDGSVFCRALGYGTARNVLYRAANGRGIGAIHFTELDCKGNELRLSNCSHKSGSSAESCGHIGDVGVECNVPPTCHPPQRGRMLKVPNPQNPFYSDNFLEVNGPLGWGLMCYGTVDLQTAQVACREAQSEFAFRTRKGTYSSYKGEHYIGQITCTGDEMSMSNCTVLVTSVTSCSNGHTIVDCTSALPDLVPDLKAFQDSLQYYPYIARLPMYYLGCAHEEKCLSSSADGKSYDHYRHLLRFSSQTMNWGTVDFLPNLQPHQWIWHTCHNHYHSFEAFMHYDLLNVTTGKKVAEGHKASFCLEDSLCRGSGSPRFRCSNRVQGISANCGDLYGQHLDCQWIDITDVPTGTYILRQHVNPDKLTAETDYRNNEVQCTIQIYPGFYLYAHSCELSDH